jgi:hypothetical protein
MLRDGSSVSILHLPRGFTTTALAPVTFCRKADWRGGSRPSKIGPAHISSPISKSDRI